MAVKNQKTQEQLLNRILINIGIAILAYMFLYVLYAKFSMIPALYIGGVFFVLAIILYVLSKVKKLKSKNYAHMFLAFGFAMIFTNLSKIAATILGFEKFIELINSSDIFKLIVNSRVEVIILSWLGAVYLLGMFVYNTVLINRLNKNRK